MQISILGALHTDCERPVSNYDIKYSFPKSNSRCSINTGCVSIEQENRTVCKCPPNAGFITFDDDTSYDSYVAVEKEVSNTRQAVILAVFIFSKSNRVSQKLFLDLKSRTSGCQIHTRMVKIDFLMVIALF